MIGCKYVGLQTSKSQPPSLSLVASETPALQLLYTLHLTQPPVNPGALLQIQPPAMTLTVAYKSYSLMHPAILMPRQQLWIAP